jgi:hypothetical protein
MRALVAGMRGSDRQTGKLFSYASPESLVPRDHPLRHVTGDNRDIGHSMANCKRWMG